MNIATTLNIGKRYKFDLSPESVIATYVRTNFEETHGRYWFEIDGGGEAYYTHSEIQSKLNSGNIWEVIKA